MKTLTFIALAAIIGAAVTGCGGEGTKVTSTGRISMWTTTSTKGAGTSYTQQDRLANPVVNEVFATFANNRHKTNNMINPSQDAAELGNDIQSFMTDAAGRSQQTIDVVKAVLARDTMVADLSQNTTTAAYLGVQTGGATGSLFGGRALGDDVVDISLGIVFGTTISDLGLAPADGNHIPTLTSDNVGSGGKQFTNSFPYLGAPR